MWYTYTIEYYSALKKEILQYGTSVNFEKGEFIEYALLTANSGLSRHKLLQICALK